MGYKKVLAAFYRGVLSSRYRVRLEGTGILADRRATLFLPNHQASVDPQIVCSQLLRYVDVSPLVTEGVIRLVIFIGYVALISLMKDIRRVYMYHGAEHKCINCIEHGMELNVENVLKSSRLHKRCGTSFLYFSSTALNSFFCKLYV